METEERESPLDLDVSLWTEEDFEYSDEETFKDEESALPDLAWLDELYEENDSDGDLAVAASNGRKRTCAETAWMFQQRRNLDQLDCFHQQKERDVLKARDELKLLRQNIESLQERRENLEEEMEHQKATGNSVAVFRLQTQLKSLCQELQREEESEACISTELRQQEWELSEVEVELGRFSSLRQEVHDEEHDFQVLKAQKAARRLQLERNASQKLQFRMQHLRDTQAALLKKQSTELQKQIEDGRANRKIAAKYLRVTTERTHQQEAAREQQKREVMEKRIQAVESLKSNIAATQKTLHIQRSRAKANAQKKEEQQCHLRKSLQAQGINSTRHMYQQKQLEEIRAKQEEFEEKQRSKRVETLDKILQEEQLAKRKGRHQAHLPKPSNKKPPQRSVIEKLQKYQDADPPLGTEESETTLRKFSDSSSPSSVSSDPEDLEETTQHEVYHESCCDSMAEPEFSGLWDQMYKTPLNEKAKLMQNQERQNKHAVASGTRNIPSRKVCRKELKGPPFMSKPEVIIFKDFQVGETYKKKVILTNVSYITNHLKLVGVSAKLHDFISINFERPGPLSTGMSFDIQAVFQPTINEDLEGEVQFASTMGQFSVPVRCSKKKCELEVDSQFIDFGSHIVGQTISRTITLSNKGALATLFSLDTSTSPIPATRHAQMTFKDSANMCQYTSSQNMTSNDQPISASVSTGELQPKQLEQDLSVASQQTHPESATDSLFIPEACVPPDVGTQIDESQTDASDISLGNVREGQIGPSESIKLELVFTPTIPGEARLDFSIKFSDSSIDSIPIKARGVAVSAPVWVVQPNIDMRICMFDHFYQDMIMVQSRATAALMLTFEVCLEMRKHMEILPKTGFIQAQSSFNAQLKFLPRISLPKDASKYFDSDTGVLEVPLSVQVTGLVQPVNFTVQAVVTSSDLKFDRTEVDFGYCSIYQSVKSSVRLSNLSLLPQDFGFLGIPEFIDVQPNDGFGTLLPKETIEIDLIFMANKAREHDFQLICKSGFNRVFTLSCRAVGVCPPLALSHSLVQFGATALGDRSTALLYVLYPHTGRNQSKQPSSLGAGGSMSALPARLFSFDSPQDPNIRITPSAGRLLPGERCLVQVTFSPRLEDKEIREEAVRLFHRAKTLSKECLESNRQEREKVESRKGKRTPVNQKHSRASDVPLTERQTESPDPVDIQPGSQQYIEARISLLYSFTRRYSEHTIPCFVSDGDPPEEDRQAQPAWSPINTLHLQLQCAAVQPPLVVVSSQTHNNIHFNQVSVGDKVTKKITVQNISKEYLELRSSLLDFYGPFMLLNALRVLRPGQQFTLVLSFTPALEKKYCEVLEVRCKRMNLELTLHGEGVIPSVTSSHPGGLFDFGYVLEKESSSQVVQLQNSSPVPVSFQVLLFSTSQPQDGDDKAAHLLASYADFEIQPTVGTQNYSGCSVFSVVPVEGSIAAGQSLDINVTFQPDHPSINYSDRLTIKLMNKIELCVLDLRGAASSRLMYLHGGDRLTVPVESLLPPLLTSQTQLTAKSRVMEKPTIPALVTLRASYSQGIVRPAVRVLQVGCIRSMQASKKSGEFHWDNLVSLQQQGFTVEPGRGSVEAGHAHTITVTWTPQCGYKPHEAVQVCVPLTLKGEVTTVYKVTLMALISTSADW